jgi:hypothetical protein
VLVGMAGTASPAGPSGAKEAAVPVGMAWPR